MKQFLGGSCFMLNKTGIINSILQLNRSAQPGWLSKFATPALRRYLEHLEVTLEPRGRESIWVRPADTAAVVTRKPTW